MIADAPELKKGEKISLRQWRIEGLFFAPADAVRLLAALGRLNEGGVLRGDDGAAVRVAPDLEFCGALLRFAGAMTARQSFLPSVESLPGGARAVWRPVFAGLERERYETVARSVPPLCRAVNVPPAGPVSSRSFVTNSMGLLVDAIVRMNQRPVEEMALGETAHQAWLTMLSHTGGTGEPPSGAPQLGESLAGLIPQLRKWRAPLAVTADAPYRLCLQLQEPDPAVFEESPPKKTVRGSDLLSGADAQWRLACYVQPADDPTLMIGAENIFTSTTKPAKTKRGRQALNAGNGGSGSLPNLPN
jgi:hypothetical protein